MSSTVLCFGEILWDVLPHGRFIGGAPLNVAYHLTQLGCTVRIVSSVGADERGTEAIEAVSRAGLAVDHIARHPTLPTGTALVHLDDKGQASYSLPQPVAWDAIPLPSPDEAVTDAIVFGTLALRNPANREALARLLDASPRAWIVCDLNLRPPFDDIAILAPLIARAHLLKVNADEAAQLCGRSGALPDWATLAQEVSSRHGGVAVCITLGSDGAGIHQAGGWVKVDSPPVVVRDTIGAGDAFTAALIAGRLRASGDPDWPRILRTACRLGGFVASCDGAQPPYGGFDPGL